ncbi:hypothetical protein [Salinirussus salinus]|uniref:hypothetical protein n=1 Tax=Salinirussus salinus TaxID=1198300 RepID=UPI001358AA2E|nr:hypothetical protein [Salinirussus salinus]
MSRWNWALFAAVSIDLLMRAVAEILGAGSVAVLSTMVQLAVQYGLGFDTIVWGYGWVMLWLIVFQVTPALFPQTPREGWAGGIPNRLLFASAAVAMGLIFESWLAYIDTTDPVAAVLLQDITGRVLVPPVDAAKLLGGVFVASLLVRYVGRTSLTDAAEALGVLYIPSQPSPLAEMSDSGSATETVTGRKYLLAVVLLGLLLSTLVVLFPLPEVILVCVQLASALAVVTAPVSRDEASISRILNGIEESLVAASTAVWGGVWAVQRVLYAFFLIVIPAFLTLGLFRVVDLGALLNQQPLETMLLAVGLLVAICHVFLYVARLCQRLYAERLEAALPPSREPPTPSPVPLMLFPAGLLFAAVSRALSEQAQDELPSPNSITTVDVSPAVAVLITVGILLAVTTVWKSQAWPSFLPTNHLPDLLVAILSLFVFGVTVELFFGTLEPGSAFQPGEILSGIVGALTQIVLLSVLLYFCLLPFYLFSS